MASEAETAAMRQAIMLSARGLGTTSPNPPVGCVILDRHDRVVGAGFHLRKGESHAEVNALSAAGLAARGGTAVVTLEPCNHIGVTPACRQELLDAGITRVVIGLVDPTSRGDGGAAVLAHAGVDVEVGVLPDEVLTVLQPWLTATNHRKPYVTWAYTASHDHGEQTNSSLLRSLRSTTDVIVSDDLLEEGTPGGHSHRHLRLAAVPSFANDPDAWLSAVFDAGVRSVLLMGPSRIAAVLQAVHAIDDLVVEIRQQTTPAWPRLCRRASQDSRSSK
jgi:diaminohydroxyphosphoribosylaminopyrimidine deaminase/5-amino-6-(5-phosphoribosylamino)uracil reductase